MQVTLFKNKSENIKLEKTLSSQRDFTGYLRGECSVISPVIEIESELNIFDWNFAYIEDFDRYYYITDIIAVRSTLWRLSLKCDVLMTFRDKIKESSALIERNQFTYDNLILDKLESFSTELQIEDTNFTNDLTKIEWEPDSGQGTTNNQLYFVTILMADWVTMSNVLEKITKTTGVYGLPNIPRTASNLMGNTFTLLLEYEDVMKLTYHARTNDLLNWIVNVSTIPMNRNNLIANFSDSSAVLTVNSVIPLGSNIEYRTVKQGYIVCRLPYLASYTHTFTIDNPTFKNYSPVSTYQLFVPFLGFIDIQDKNVINKTIKIVYVYDVVSGDSIVHVLADQKIIYTGSCQLGTNLIITADNSFQNSILRKQTTLNIVTGSVGGVSNIVGGVMSGQSVGGALSLVNGTNNIVNTIVSDVSNLDNIRHKATATITSGTSGNATSLVAFLRRTYQTTLLNTESKLNDYLSLNGKPLNQYKALEELTGFTIVNNIHLENFTRATMDEKMEIESILKSGVIL